MAPICEWRSLCSCMYKVTIRPVLNGTVPFFGCLSQCPEKGPRDTKLSRFQELDRILGFKLIWSCSLPKFRFAHTKTEAVDSAKPQQLFLSIHLPIVFCVRPVVAHQVNNFFLKKYEHLKKLHCKLRF